MDVQRICFLGTRTAHFDATAAFFKDVLGLEYAQGAPGYSVFRLPSGGGDYVEIFGREADPSRLPAEVVDGVFVAFAVDDIAGAREEFATADVELIGDLVWAAEGYGWFYFRAPDGNIYVMQQDTRSSKA